MRISEIRLLISSNMKIRLGLRATNCPCKCHHYLKSNDLLCYTGHRRGWKEAPASSTKTSCGISDWLFYILPLFLSDALLFYWITVYRQRSSTVLIRERVSSDIVFCAYNSLWQTAKPQEFSIFTEEERHKTVGYS